MVLVERIGLKKCWGEDQKPALQRFAKRRLVLNINPHLNDNPLIVLGGGSRIIKK